MRYMTSSRGPRRALLIAGVAGVLLANGAWATANHAHHHYHMGIRAYAGSKHATMLHHELSEPGWNLVLARDNALEMETLAHEIERRADELTHVISDEEAVLISVDVARMSLTARQARRDAAELGVWLDDAIAEDERSADEQAELDTRVRERTRVLFAAFKTILKAHKTAETKLGIPVPADPPEPSHP